MVSFLSLFFVSLASFQIGGEKKKKKERKATPRWSFESRRYERQCGSLQLLSKNSEKLASTGKIDYANASDSCWPIFSLTLQLCSCLLLPW